MHFEQEVELHHKVVSLIKTNKKPLTMDIGRHDIKRVSYLLCSVKKMKA